VCEAVVISFDHTEQRCGNYQLNSQTSYWLQHFNNQLTHTTLKKLELLKHF